MSRAGSFLTHEILRARRLEHGFGTRGAQPPQGLLRPRQVHGTSVAVVAGEPAWREPPEADAIVTGQPGRAVGIVSADCVPVLLAAGRCVAAVHAGWRGLAQGILERAVAVLRQQADGDACVAAIGPHIGPCCYEIDAPVIDGLRLRFAGDLPDALQPSRPGHHRLDLGILARRALARSGVAEDAVGSVPDACTCCDAGRFHSYRREGSAAGRQVHFVVASPGGGTSS